MTGKVYLVGGGPGDPELLTLKAARVLRHADVVLHDALVSAEILRLAPRHAQIRNVGKRCGKKTITQEEINFLMVSLAASGLQVVRLKGGDPLIFGRIGEEIAALRSAKIEFEIVPGITAALGAASSAQVPLTNRQSSHALVFLAGRNASGTDQTNWPALVSLGATIVIYMPGHHYCEIAEKLRSAGLPDETPCAITSRATTPEEQVFSTTLGKLRDTSHLPTPSLLLIGEVLRHADPRLALQELPSSNFAFSSGWPLSVTPAIRLESDFSPSSATRLEDQEQGA